MDNQYKSMLPYPKILDPNGPGLDGYNAEHSEPREFQLQPDHQAKYQTADRSNNRSSNNVFIS